MSDDEYYESYLQINAKPERMGSVLADLVRQIMRASTSSTRGQEYKAVDTLEFLLNLYGRSEGVRILDFIERAVEDLNVEVQMPASRDADQIRIAQAGLRNLIVCSCNDTAAVGRAS